LKEDVMPRAAKRHEETGDPVEHTRFMRERLAEVIDDLRADIGRIDEPQFKAMFETAAEVLGGLVTAFRHYEDKSERAWTRS
jgi:hypothetical protein